MVFILSVISSVGSDLRQCTKSEQQCCTNAFLEAVELNITRRLKESLSDEFKEVIEVYLDDVENLLDCKSIINLVQ